MHNVPGAFFGSKDHRDPQIERRDVLPFAYLGLIPLYPHHVGKLRDHIFLYDLKASNLATADLRSGMLHSRTNLLPSMRERANRVKESYVFSMGVDHLLGSGFPLTNSPSAC